MLLMAFKVFFFVSEDITVKMISTEQVTSGFTDRAKGLS